MSETVFRILRASVLCAFPLAIPAAASEPGLLFHLSGDRGFTADYAAGGDAEPNFLSEVRVIPGGAKGPGFECAHTQLMSYWAPGNIYAQRGTLAFFWRSREPVGKTAFPVFRVGYADHSSWDMVWLRIDYNGRNGFDAFVTDASLARTRVSYTMPRFPRPDEWVHLAFAWDETRGVRLWVNGRPAARKEARAVYYAGLDQFGPHSRIISPYQVQSAYTFVRGGDIDEVRIYDRMLEDTNAAALATGAGAGAMPPLDRDLARSEWREEWSLRYGWNRAGDPPPYLAGPFASVRKVEIHDVYDLKRWWWKATDGIRETTWPGVFNRSRLAGRNDYFQLPDWDCYSLSGKSVTFFMPQEPWNHLEISGAAWGRMTLEGYDYEKSADAAAPLFERPRGQEKTYHRLAAPAAGQRIRFDNVEQETPIGELSAYYVTQDREPQGVAKLSYTIAAGAAPDNRSVEPLVRFIDGRYAPDERAIVMALPARAPRSPRAAPAVRSLPLVHVLIPVDFRSDGQTTRAFSYTWENMNAGLDGIAIDLPALSVKPTHGEFFPLNIQVKDPLLPMRNLADFTFSVRPGEAKTLWLDLRDRILPNGRSLYFTVAGAGPDFGAASLDGARLRLVFKERAAALREHEIDRFTQVRDNYAHIVEEHPNSRRLNLFNRFAGDLTDLLRVSPDHWLGRAYWHEINPEQPAPPVELAAPPPGVPLWAFRQVEQLRRLKHVVEWWIDHRQIDNGEFGGGLSDDGDLTNWWPSTALMGASPEKIARSLARETDAFYEQGMFANGLPAIQTDELHTYEEGIQAVAQSMLLDFGNPKQIERAMETSRALQGVTGVNSAGHRHIRSTYYSGTAISDEGVWAYSKPSSYLVLHPALALVEFNGNPAARRLIVELADGMLAHRKPTGGGRFTIDTTIHFPSDRGTPTGIDRVWHLFWAAWRWTGERKYLDPLVDEGAGVLNMIGANALDMLNVREQWGKQLLSPGQARGRTAGPLHFAWQLTGNKAHLEELYGAQIRASAVREYINTEGSVWSDRVTVDHVELQRARLGGVAIARNYLYPGHAVSWKFLAPATEQSVAILIPDPTPSGMTILVRNLEPVPVGAVVTGWDVEPGEWEMRQGIDTDGDDKADAGLGTTSLRFERTAGKELRFAPASTTVITMKLKSKGTPYWQRPDWGIGPDDVKVEGATVKVRVHSLGSVAAPATTMELRDRSGRTIASAAVPGLEAPNDLEPRSATVALTAPAGADLRGGSVEIDAAGKLNEITRRNNRAGLRQLVTVVR